MNQSLFLLVLMGLCSVTVCQNYSYHFINENKTWCEARQYCREHYTDLATVYNQADAERICGSADHCPGAWIGLQQKECINETWHWSQPGLALEGDHPKENCVLVDQPFSHNAGCYERSWFICLNNSSGPTFPYNISNNATLKEALKVCNKTLQHSCPICWMGLFRVSWGWSDGSNSSFRYWHKNETYIQPRDNQKCARLGEKKEWMSANCTERHPFICYDDHMILIKEKKSWEEALYYCRRNHRDLAVITDEHLRRMVQERANVADTTYVWVGLHYTCFFEAWVWVDGQYVYNGNWDKEEPHQCGLAGAMAKGGENKWSGKSAGDKYNFVCSVSC